MMIQVQCRLCNRLREVTLKHTNFTAILCQVCASNGELGFMAEVVE